MDRETFTIYWLLKEEGVQKAEEVAKKVKEIMDKYPHWRTSSHQERELRRSLLTLAKDLGGLKGVSILDRILNYLRQI